MAAFESGRATVALISNFESVDGRTLPQATDKLVITKKTYQRSSFVIVTGQRSAVARERKRQLAKLGDDDRVSGNQIRDVMARINTLAAAAGEPRRSVSDDCSVYSMDVGGNGVHELSEGSRVDSITIMNGIVLPGLEGIAKLLNKDPAKMAIVGSTFATTAQTLTKSPECSPSRIHGASAYTLGDLSVPGMAESTPLAVGSHDGELAISGICSPPENRGHYDYWVWKDSFKHKFFGVSVINGCGLAFLSDESAVVTATVSDRQEVLLLDGDQRMKFDKLGRYDAGCQGANAEDQVAGWVGGLSGSDRGQHSWRPAVWNRSGEVIDILEGERLCGADWGYTQAIRNNKVLVIAYVGDDPVLLLWEIGGEVERVASPGQGIMGVGFIENSIVGFTKGPPGQSVAALRSAKGNWEQLGTPPGWLPLDCNDSGTVCGRQIINGFSTPVLWTEERSLILTTYRFHHVSASRISKDGRILGKAHADHGIHAMVWRPS